MNPKISIFTIPKPFEGHINIIQRNAIKSWTLLESRPEIILFGQEKGVSEITKEFGIRHIPEIEKNEFGTPFINSVFNLAKEQANNNLLVYVNSDIILMDNFMKAIEETIKSFPSFLMVSQRWDLDIKEEIQFKEIDWKDKLREYLKKEGIGPVGTDCFVFPRYFQHDMPFFVVGRDGWDNWLLYHTRSLGIPLIDGSRLIKAIHQNHDYFHYPEGKKVGKELQKNLELLGSSFNAFSPKDADWVLSEQGFKKQKRFFIPRPCYRFFGSLPAFYPYFSLWLKGLLLPVWFLAMIAKFGKKTFFKKYEIFGR